MAFVLATPAFDAQHDSHDYDRLGCAVAVGAGYPRTGPVGLTPQSCGRAAVSAKPTVFRPPGYPALLGGIYTVADAAGVQDRWQAARLVNAVLGSVVVALLAFIALRLWGRRVALVATGLAAVFPPMILSSGTLLTETPFTALMLGAVACAVAARENPRDSGPAGSRRLLGWALLAGLLVGLALLTRTNGPVLPVVLALAFWRRPLGSWRSLAAPALLLAVAALTVLPWTLRNHDATGAFVPVNAEYGSAVIGTYNAESAHQRYQPGRWIAPRFLPSLRGLFRGLPASEPEEQRALFDAGVDYAVDHPAYPFEVAGRNVVRLTGVAGPQWWAMNSHLMSVPVPAGDVAAWSFFPVALLALLGACTPAARRAPYWLWLLPVLTLLSVIFLVGETRFRAPIDPFVVLLAALALTWPAKRKPKGVRPL